MANTPSNEVDIGTGEAAIPTVHVAVTDADFDTAGMNDTEHEKLISSKTFHDDEKYKMAPPPYYEMERSELGQQPKEYLVGAILVTLFCCMPIGLVAIIRAMTVRVENARGDAYAAKKASRSARRFIILSVVVGICLMVICYTAMYMEVKFFMNLMLQQKCIQNAVSGGSRDPNEDPLQGAIQC